MVIQSLGAGHLRILCGIKSFRKVIMAEEKEREVKNAAKDLVKTQRRAAR